MPTNNYGFLHLATLGNWKQRFQRFLREIESTNLYFNCTYFFLGILGEFDRPFTEECIRIERLEMGYHGLDMRKGIKPTYLQIQKFCNLNLPARIFYSDLQDLSVVQLWQPALNHLRDHDLVLTGKGSWWANTAYLKTLPLLNPTFDMDLDPEWLFCKQPQVKTLEQVITLL